MNQPDLIDQTNGWLARYRDNRMWISEDDYYSDIADAAKGIFYAAGDAVQAAFDCEVGDYETGPQADQIDLYEVQITIKAKRIGTVAEIEQDEDA